MDHLYQQIAVRVDQWRSGNFACGDYSAIAEVLEWVKETETGNLRFLRRPRLRKVKRLVDEKQGFWLIKIYGIIF